MFRRATLGVCAVLVGVGTYASNGAAQSRFHIGLESSVYSNNSVEGERAPTSSSSSSSSNDTPTKYVAKVSRFGLPGSAALPIGVLLGDHWDLGARFAYDSTTTKLGVDASAPEVGQSTVSLSPYLAYLAGSRGDSVRFTVGASVGVGTSTISTKTQDTSSSSSTSSTTTETTTSATQLGAFIGLRGFVSDMGSVDPALMVLRNSTSYKLGDTSVDLTGTSILLNVGFTFWTGGAAAAPSATPNTTSSTTPSAPGATASATSDAPAPPTERSDWITLPMGDSHAVTFMLAPAGEAPEVTVVLRDEAFTPQNTFNCQSATFHAFRQEETVVELTPGMASSNTRRFPILKGKIALDRLRLLVASPIASSAAAPDHWLDVCGTRWMLAEGERGRLKRFFDALPPAPAPTSSPASTSAPTATPAASSTPAAPAPTN
jgi:hypothetical protein